MAAALSVRLGGAVALFLAVWLAVLRPPRPLSIGSVAVLGAAVAVATGLVSLAEVGRVVSVVGDATLAFVGIVLLALVLDGAGLFEWSARHLVRVSGRRPAVMFAGTLALGAAISGLFSNDGAALILTPILFEQVRALDWPPSALRAFVMAGGFIADATSLPLVVSNLVNIIVADFFHLGFVGYAVRMIPVDLVAFAASTGMLWLVYRSVVPARVPEAALAAIHPEWAVPDPPLLRRLLWVLAALAIAYPVAERLGLPVAVPVDLAAGVALLLGRASPALSVRRVVLEAPWRIIVFAAGMYVVVAALARAGLTGIMARLLGVALRHGPAAAALFTGFLSAGLSSVANNLPATLLSTLAVHALAADASVTRLLALAVAVGCDLGPKFTPIGSLATLLWLHVLERRGLKITAGYYMRMGLVLTLPVLLATLLTLVLVARV